MSHRYKRLFSFTLLSLFFLQGATQLLSQQLYNSVIYTVQRKDADIESAVSDLAACLNKAGAGKFRTLTGNGMGREDGIWLRELNADQIDDPFLRPLRNDGQSFHILASKNRVIITGTGSNSIVNGIYTFLKELGFRWYMPGDVWTVVPSSKSIRQIKMDKVFTPSFRNRSYFAAGTTNAIPDIDPANTFEKDFLLWNKRNRWGSDYILKGHAGGAFYKAQKKELDANPKYFCNGIPNPNGRIDISQPGAVKLFVDWAANQKKSDQRFQVIGVDPEDGSGQKDDCLPSDMKEIHTWSDKYFWLANKVGDRIGDLDSNTVVQLYAYSAYAQPPSFSIDKAVYPIIVPYAYQRFAEPDQMITAWSRKMEGRRMGIYDYWNSTLDARCLPRFNFYSIPGKLRLWKENNIQSVHLESTYSKGALGLTLWLAAEQLWNIDADQEKLYQEFLSDCFGPSAKDVGRMLNRWATNFQESMEPALSFVDLQQAESRTRDMMIRKRILELKAYVYYIKLYYQYQADHTVGHYKELISYVKGIHHLRLLHTSALLNRYIELPPGYSVQNSGKEIAKTTPYTDSELEGMTDKIAKESSALYKISSFRLDISKVSLIAGGTPYQPPRIDAKMNFLFFLKKPTSLTFQAGATDETNFVLRNEQGQILFETVIPASAEGYQFVKADLPEGTISLQFGAQYRFARLKFPPDLVYMTSSTNYSNYLYPKQYIYIPADVSEIVYQDGFGPGVNNKGFWIDPAGKKITPVKIGNTIYKVNVPNDQRGHVWSFEVGHSSYKMLNIQHLFSPNRFLYEGRN